MAEKIKILYVDDEPDNLIGFKATLRMNYQVFVTDKIDEAFAILDQHPDIRVVFCDQRMPGMSGAEFFEVMRQKHQLPVRILLTGYSDAEATIAAINKGNIFRYVQKPWKEPDILSAIDEAGKFYMATSMLAVKNNELQTAYDELNKFAYSVSHDIRGPLTGILGAINVAHDIDDIDEMKEMLLLMEKSISKLDSYIINMHDYYSLQRGELKIAEISFEEFFNELKPLYEVSAKVNDVEFDMSITQTETFRNDRDLLKLIFNNLLSNAFKYQDKRKINKRVEVTVEVKNNTATVCVKDTGVGILGNHIGEIFNLFYRANSQEVGSGFGLYNVKGALLKLNGQIEVNSVMDQGTTFKVTIPSL
ncbi:hybrid sensor histidine kinase/response regulator [Mucilaginibacter sp. UR6-1]|uniref:hybrid sensor histidine kinase/response regulator n=1 Tax=Mucilaginibacter sp. UR6-1 TaxID=1435643 RepID=UPI001E3E03E6|nr:hybrid sensor histidine kinase/response regulator [Mucilaginibacter sp. UR6-1]MCC8409307.1 hybrid sensor histidine kinase/response regulator [Mucilaginibacter sp. UR6-1]